MLPKYTKNTKFELIEEKGDLFDVPHGFYFAHCISADFVMGAGIAVAFVKMYNMREKLNDVIVNPSADLFPGLLSNKEKVGTAIKVDNVFNLITKREVWMKPTYEDLRSSLVDMKNQMINYKIDKLAIPKIGCGIDGLNWIIVKNIIEEIFKDTSIKIIVRYLED